MSNISPNPGELSPELVEALKNAASVAEMQEIQRAWLVEHGAERDRFSPDKLILDRFKAPDAASGQSFSREIVIRGIPKVVVADSELALERAVGKALQEAMADGGAGGGDADAGTQRSTVQARHPLAGQFIDASNPHVQVEMKELLRTGRITPEEYIAAQPQTLDGIMRERYGISAEQVESERFQWTWAKATEEFLKSPSGSDWPGTDANRDRLGEVLKELNLVDQPSPETLARAYQYMKENNLLVANPEIEAQKSISEALSVEDIRAAAYRAQGLEPPTSRGSGGFWRR